MRVVSDIAGLAREAPPGMDVEEIKDAPAEKRWARVWRLFWASRNADYLVVHFFLPEVIVLSILLWAWPGVRCSLVTLDFFAISPPAWLMPLVKWSLGRCGALLVYFKSHQGVQKRYALPDGKLRYVPFKVNAWELVAAAERTEQDYIFVGGRSRRDFATLFSAAGRLPYYFRVLTAPQAHLLSHGSTMAEVPKPANVELDYRDSDTAHFIGVMSGAKLVVLPIREDAEVQAGIGVCLQALALGKCVIISEALGISDVLVNGEAVIVKPADVNALVAQIERYWQDSPARQGVGQRARNYGMALGGEAVLYRSVLAAIEELSVSDKCLRN